MQDLLAALSFWCAFNAHLKLFGNYVWFTYGQEKPKTKELLWWKETFGISGAAVGQVLGFFVILGFGAFSKIQIFAFLM